MFNKKIVGCLSVLTLLLCLSAEGTVSNAAYKEALAEETTNEPTVDIENATLLAGTTASLEEAEIDGCEIVSVEKEDAAIVTAAEEPEPELTEEEQEWLNYLMADVSESLNVRAEADADSDIVGKLYKGDLATIEEAGDTWTKIVSGNVEGYVLNEYCVTGLDALAYARENVITVAKVTQQGLRMRSEMSTDSSIVKTLDEGAKLTVDVDAETIDGWIAVSYSGKSGYVCADYVEIYMDLGTGVTIEEEREAQAAAEAAAEAAKAKQTDGAETTYSSSVAASASELDLLAAIVYCEAGGESYDCQLAVASVVMNRVRSGSYPSTLYDVIYQSGQFTPARNGKLSRAISNGSASSTSYQAAQAALDGADNTNGALSFRDYSSRISGVVYGGMIFY